MSSPIDQLQPPPTSAAPPSSGHGSVGPVIAVLAVISILGVIAGMIGRLCAGRPVLGYGGHYDLESWVETKCASCIDGSLDPPPPRRPPPPAVESIPVAEPVGGPPEMKEGQPQRENLQPTPPGSGGES